MLLEYVLLAWLFYHLPQVDCQQTVTFKIITQNFFFFFFLSFQTVFKACLIQFISSFTTL